MKRSKVTSPETSSTLSGGQSLRARLSKPFVSRSRHVAGFQVQAEDPYRSYSPGDLVKGSVLLEVDRVVDITHLVVCLHGCVKVLNKTLPPGQNIPSDSTLLSPSKKQGPGYFGNGFASLFEKEDVLCGEGRLETGRYRFHFEVRFPAKGLPSSIDFERGTITYLVTATLTRPSTMYPLTSCHHKIKFTDDIDISLIPPPKPRASTLLPGRRKSERNSQSASRIEDPREGSMREPHVEGEESRAASLPDNLSTVGPPESPALSEISATSATSSSRSWHLVTSSSMKLSQIGAEAIHAVLELPLGGCLPGDRVPILINIKHVKPVKNMNGIIVTLFRTCRVDTHPNLPLGPVKKGSKLEYEDYYPRSKTGLGGLSLSSAGSHKTFRQDLNQVYEPLIIDPHGLKAQIKTHIKVPDEVFPSIITVPGSMISFKYEVEIVVDLRGKMAGQDFIRSQMGMISVPRGNGLGDPKKHGVDGSTGLVFPLASGFGCLDTSQMRREKFVISRTFGLVVGTRDSERSRLRKLGKQATASPTQSLVSTPAQERQPPFLTHQIHPTQTRRAGSPVAAHSHCFSPPGSSSTRVHEQQLPPCVPALDALPDDGLDEKTRLRNAEARLLPSAPPADGNPSVLARPDLQPSAPPASDDIMSQEYPGLHHVISASGHSVSTIVPAYSARPQQEDSRIEDADGDKEELEAERLLRHASWPDGTFDHNPLCSVLEPNAPQDDGVPSSGLESVSPATESTRSESNSVSVGHGESEGLQALDATNGLLTGSDPDPPRVHGGPEPSALASLEDHDVYEAHPTHIDLKDEHLPVYQK